MIIKYKQPINFNKKIVTKTGKDKGRNSTYFALCCSADFVFLF